MFKTIKVKNITVETQAGYDAGDTWQEVKRYGISDTASNFYGDRDSYNEMYPNSNEYLERYSLRE